MRDDPGGLWPTRTQDLLITAATAPPSRAAPALQRWWQQVDLDHLDDASTRLLPQLHVNLSERGVDPPSTRLRGIHRQSWYRNRLHLRMLERVVERLAAQGIEPMLTKGLSLALRSYRDVGARPMSDVDVVVRRPDALRARDVLLADGWEPAFPWRDGVLDYAHSHPFRHSDGWELDLHWHVSFLAAHEEADAQFWAGSAPVPVGDAQVRLLAPADELLLVVTHGLEWNVVPPFRWIVDAMVLVDHQPIDWHRLLARTVELEVVLPMQDGLRGLASRGCDVPSHVLRTLERQHVPLWQRLERRAVRAPWSSTWGPPAKLLLRRWRARRGRAGQRPVRHLLGFFAWRLGVDDAGQLPEALRGYVRRLRQRRERLG